MAEKQARRRWLYRAALEASERKVLAEAAAVEGLTEELALLRVLTHRLLGEQPRPWRHLLEALALVVRAVALEQRRQGAGDGAVDVAALDRAIAALDALTEDEGDGGRTW